VSYRAGNRCGLKRCQFQTACLTPFVCLSSLARTSAGFNYTGFPTGSSNWCFRQNPVPRIAAICLEITNARIPCRRQSSRASNCLSVESNSDRCVHDSFGEALLQGSSEEARRPRCAESFLVRRKIELTQLLFRWGGRRRCFFRSRRARFSGSALPGGALPRVPWDFSPGAPLAVGSGWGRASAPRSPSHDAPRDATFCPRRKPCLHPSTCRGCCAFPLPDKSLNVTCAWFESETHRTLSQDGPVRKSFRCLPPNRRTCRE